MGVCGRDQFDSVDIVVRPAVKSTCRGVGTVARPAVQSTFILGLVGGVDNGVDNYVLCRVDRDIWGCGVCDGGDGVVFRRQRRCHNFRVVGRVIGPEPDRPWVHLEPLRLVRHEQDGQQKAANRRLACQ